MIALANAALKIYVPLGALRGARASTGSAPPRASASTRDAPTSTKTRWKISSVRPRSG